MMWSDREHGGAESGFTLIEMLVVIAIIGAAAALIIPAMNRPSDRLVLRETVGKISAALRLTRSAAIARNSEQLFVIDLSERRFGSDVAGNGRFPGQLSASFQVAEPERLSPSQGGIRFFPDGSSTGGELTLALNGEEARLCVHWLVGRPVEAEAC